MKRGRDARRRDRKRSNGILRVKRGFNPNSSSLGFDVTFLLATVGGLSMFSAAVSMLLRLRKPTPHGTALHGGDPPLAAPAATTEPSEDEG